MIGAGGIGQALFEARSTHLFGEARLARLNAAALLVNPARGSLVDEVAVARALASGRLGGSAADAFEMDDPSAPTGYRLLPPELLRHPRWLLTPHFGSATVCGPPRYRSL